LRAYGALLEAAIKEFVRDRTSMTMLFVVPLLFVLFFGMASSSAAAGTSWMGRPGRAVDFLTPGVLGMSIMWLGVFAALPLVAQREQEVLKRFALTPVSRSTIVAAQVTSRLLSSLLQGALVLLVAGTVFGVPVQGNPLLVAAVLLLGTLAFVALGYVVAALVPTQQSAHGWTQLVTLPMLFLCGVFLPTEALPGVLHPFIAVLPLTLLVDALRQAALGAAGAASLAVDMLGMLLWAAASFVVAVRCFRWI